MGAVKRMMEEVAERMGIDDPNDERVEAEVERLLSSVQRPQPTPPLPEILDQMMPAPDEAPLTSCPHCGEEYNVKEDDSDLYYDVEVEETPGTQAIYRHKKCGKLVRFVGTGADSEVETGEADV